MNKNSKVDGNVQTKVKVKHRGLEKRKLYGQKRPTVASTGWSQEPRLSMLH